MGGRRVEEAGGTGRGEELKYETGDIIGPNVQRTESVELHWEEGA